MKTKKPRGIGMARASAFALLGFAALSLSATAAESRAPTLPPELEALCDQLAKYKDPVAAVRDGYLSTLGCVPYESGAMGVHFLNPALISPELDPGKPNILVYAPACAKLTLVTAHWPAPLPPGPP